MTFRSLAKRLKRTEHRGHPTRWEFLNRHKTGVWFILYKWKAGKTKGISLYGIPYYSELSENDVIYTITIYTPVQVTASHIFESFESFARDMRVER